MIEQTNVTYYAVSNKNVKAFTSWLDLTTWLKSLNKFDRLEYHAEMRGKVPLETFPTIEITPEYTKSCLDFLRSFRQQSTSRTVLNYEIRYSSDYDRKISGDLHSISCSTGWQIIYYCPVLKGKMVFSDIWVNDPNSTFEKDMVVLRVANWGTDL